MVYSAGVYLVQKTISDLAIGIDPGPLDGQWGSQTLAAVKAFREIAGLPDAGDAQIANLDTGFMLALQKAATIHGITFGAAPATSAATSPTRGAARTPTTPGATPGATPDKGAGKSDFAAKLAKYGLTTREVGFGVLGVGVLVVLGSLFGGPSESTHHTRRRKAPAFVPMPYPTLPPYYR